VTNVAFLKVTAFNFIQIYYDNCYEKMNESPVMPTIRDVAELACVSVATVSRVINHSPSVSEPLSILFKFTMIIAMKK